MSNTIKNRPHDAVCARWYFTFDGEECTPPIDGVVYEGQIGNSHYPHYIGGYCDKTEKDKDTCIKKGEIKIDFRIGPCRHKRQEGIPYLGLDSVSRIIITEVPPPQDKR